MTAPLALYSTSVKAQWVDYNDHLSEWAYLLIFGENADAFFRYLGIDDDYRAAGHSLYTAETHLRHLREVKLGQPLTLTLQVLGFDSKRLHILHQMQADQPGCVATAEQMLLHVDTGSGRVAPFGTELAARVGQIAEAHRTLPWPDFAGRPIRSLAGA